MPSSDQSGARRTDLGGALVISNRVDPDVPDSIIDELLNEGIVGLADYDLGPSVDKNDLPKENTTGRGSLSDLEKFSRVGGYILAHTDGSNRIIAGRARSESLRIERVRDSTDDLTVLKCIQLDAYGDIDPDEFQGIKR